MANYEIMLIVDPKEDIKNVETLVKEVINNPKIEKMDRTELAYAINKSNTATYLLINAQTDGDAVKELTRKTNISKTVWRMLAVNLDTEIGREEGIKKLAKRRADFEVYKKEQANRTEGQGSYREQRQQKEGN